jgi:nucleoside-diphosphate-sugar epimerase
MLRYFSVYGPRQRPDMAFNQFCRAAIEGNPLLVFGDGTQTRDFTFVSDAVAATRAAARVPKAGGKAYNIGGGSQIALGHAIRLIEEFAGQTLEAQWMTPSRGDVRSTAAEITQARADLGYQPATPFEQGLLAEFEWMRESVRLPGTEASRTG